MGICIWYEAKMNTRTRNIVGFSLIFFSNLMLLLLDLVTSGRGGIGVFVGICFIVAVFGISDVLVTGGVIGELSFMCPGFIQSYYGGMAACGAMTSVLRLITKAAFENAHNGLRKGVLLFFAISISIELMCILLYAFYLPKLPIVNYYRTKASKEGSKTVTSDLRAAGIRVPENQVSHMFKSYLPRLSTRELVIENIDYLLDMYFTYSISLSIFPGFISENTSTHGMGTWYMLLLIAMYNLWDLIGRYVRMVDAVKLKSRRWLMVATLARFLLIPAFYFTAKYADKGWMVALTSFLGLTSGYLIVCVVTLAPRGYKGPEQNALGNLLVLFVLAGIFTGVAFDWMWMIGKKHSS
ncbi:Equilibrative nucleotide transporter 3 [Linum perenne]